MEERTEKCLKYLKMLLEQSMTGLIAEFGCNSGITTIHLAELAARYDRKIIGFDAFIGFPYAEYDLKVGECTALRSQLEKNLADHKISNVEIVEGLVEETILEYKDQPFLFAFLDMDLEKTTQAVADVVAVQMVVGGIMVFHDYGFVRTPGIKIVADAIISSGDWEVLNRGVTLVLKKLR